MFKIRPLLNAFVVLACGIGAVSAIPEFGWVEAGALRESGVLMCAGLMFSLLVATFRNPLAVFRTEHIVMFGLVYWLLLDTVQGAFDLPVEREGLVRIFIGTTVFGCFFWIGCALASYFGRRPAASPAAAPATRSDIGPGFIVWGAIICALLSLSYPVLTCQFTPSCLYDAVTAPRFGDWRIDHSWGTLKKFRYAGYLALPLTVAYFMIHRRWTFPGFLAIVLTAFVVMIAANEGRRGFGTTVGAALMIFVLLRPRIRVRHLLGLIVGAALLLLFLQAMLSWRDHGVGRSLLEGREITADREGLIAVDKNIYHGSRAMAIVPEQHPHTGFRGLAATLLQPIPRSIWPDKPFMRGFFYAYTIQRRGDLGWTATFSIIADMYVIGGWLGLVLGGMAYGGLAQMTSRLLVGGMTLRRRLMFAAATMTLFVSLRAFHELSVTGFSVLALWGLFLMRDYFSQRVQSTVSSPDNWSVRATGSPAR